MLIKWTMEDILTKGGVFTKSGLIVNRTIMNDYYVIPNNKKDVFYIYEKNASSKNLKLSDFVDKQSAKNHLLGRCIAEYVRIPSENKSDIVVRLVDCDESRFDEFCRSNDLSNLFR